jgi:DNA-binding LacI/PurR family transcriptional regulator
MMTLPAIQYLLKQGYSVPRDYRAGGFNNSIESRIFSSPFSTVHIPYTDMSGEAFKILKQLFAEKNVSPGTIRDKLLPCEVIIRGDMDNSNISSNSNNHPPPPLKNRKSITILAPGFYPPPVKKAGKIF